MKNIFIVSTGGMHPVIQGIFTEHVIAEEFAKLYDNVHIDKEVLYDEYPKVYRYACTIDLETKEIIKIEPCTPSVNPLLMTLQNKILYAVGETKAEAQYNAEVYLEKLHTT